MRVRARAWQSAKRSSSATAEKFGWSRSWARVRRFISRYRLELMTMKGGILAIKTTEYWGAIFGLFIGEREFKWRNSRWLIGGEKMDRNVKQKNFGRRVWTVVFLGIAGVLWACSPAGAAASIPTVGVLTPPGLTYDPLLNGLREGL